MDQNSEFVPFTAWWKSKMPP